MQQRYRSGERRLWVARRHLVHCLAPRTQKQRSRVGRGPHTRRCGTGCARSAAFGARFLRFAQAVGEAGHAQGAARDAGAKNFGRGVDGKAGACACDAGV